MPKPALGTAYGLVPTLPDTFTPSTEDAARQAERLDPRDGWQVVLLMDRHEFNQARFTSLEKMRNDINKHFNSTHPYEARSWDHAEITTLKAGDYVWVARRWTSNGRKYEEFVLNFCVERKAASDMNRCLTSNSGTYAKITKMETQMRKLRHCGISNPTILVEGGDAIPYKCVQTLTDELKNNLHKGFSVAETRDHSCTVAFLIEQQQRLRHKLPVAPARTLIAVNRSVKNAMDCPKFQFFCRLLKLNGVGLESARALVEHFPTEDELRRAVQQDECQIASIKTSSDRRLNSRVVESLQKEYQGQASLYQDHDHFSARLLNTTPVLTLEPTAPYRSHHAAHRLDQVHQSALFHTNVEPRDLGARVNSHTSGNHDGTRHNPISLLDDPTENPVGSTRTISRRRRNQSASLGCSVPVPYRKKSRADVSLDQGWSVSRRPPQTWTCVFCSYAMNTEDVIHCFSCKRPCY